MRNEYHKYLDKICSLMKKKFQLAEQKKEQRLEETLILEIRERTKELLRMEKEGLEGDEFWPLPYLLYIIDASDFERHLLYLLFFQEVCPQASLACKSLNETSFRTYVNWEIAVETFEGKFQQTKELPLFFETSFFRTLFLASEMISAQKEELRLDERILDLILSQSIEYGGYEGVSWILEEETKPFVWQESLLYSMNFCLSKDSNQRRILQLYGSVGSGKKTMLRQISARKQKQILLLKMDQMRGEKEQVFRIWWRECFFWNALPAIETKEGESQRLEFFLSSMSKKLPNLILLSKERQNLYIEDAVVFDFSMDEVAKKSQEKFYAYFSKSYNWKEGVDFKEIAAKFYLTPAKIKKVCAMADGYRQMQGQETISYQNLYQACRAILDVDWKERAQKIESRFTWEDLVLPKPQKNDLKIACNQVKYRHKVYEEWEFGKTVPYGRGVSILLSGPPGTGKTMAAQVIAGEIGMDLYRVSLPAVVSKYIGETEKNLNDIFERAKKSQVILFFDEADVLFSKRTEVKDSNDKYNNMEAAFLLQKMEDYEGVTLLATNYLKNFDEAFKRRIKFIVDFPFPDTASREKIWRKLIPDFLVTQEIDFSYLAEGFELSGSNIKNIVLYAVFLIADSKRSLGMRELLQGIKNEYYKLGKVLSERELGEYAFLLEENSNFL